MFCHEINIQSRMKNKIKVISQLYFLFSTRLTSWRRSTRWLIRKNKLFFCESPWRRATRHARHEWKNKSWRSNFRFHFRDVRMTQSTAPTPLRGVSWRRRDDDTDSDSFWFRFVLRKRSRNVSRIVSKTRGFSLFLQICAPIWKNTRDSPTYAWGRG